MRPEPVSESLTRTGSRVLTTRGDARSFAEPPHVDTAVERLTALNPRAIIYAWTSSSYFFGPEGDEALRLRLEARAPGVPIVLAAVAASEALRALSVHRMALVHPPWFSEETNDRGRDYFKKLGFEVVSCAGHDRRPLAGYPEG